MKYLSSLNLKPFHKRFSMACCPVVAFEKLYRDARFSFLYESLESPTKRGRFSFLGGRPYLSVQSRRNHIRIGYGGEVHQETGNPFTVLRALVNGRRTGPQILPFAGGAVGYVSYDAIRFIEKIQDDNPDELGVPDTNFIFPAEVVVFDHQEKTVDIIVYSEEEGARRLEELRQTIAACAGEPARRFEGNGEGAMMYDSNFKKESFKEMVRKSREYILAGDIFQVVLSQRFSFPLRSDPFLVYSALRRTNPSPYMYYLCLDDLQVAGSSPEILVKVMDKKVTTRPLAGTRPRGKTAEEDLAVEKELLADEKERAEHIMLLDLARNDIGRVCIHGSVRPTDLMSIERYSKVMHIVSNVTGDLRPDRDAFDVFEASFPAGTVSGAPKVRSMQIIDELENTRRGIYAGAIGYFDFSGNMDMCIAIRTIVMKDGKGYIQAGAGIVADSDPEREYQETCNKARALMSAVDMTGG